jgi:hypothetical protein
VAPVNTGEKESQTMITIAIQCHHFQRRLCWMLSSLVQQTLAGVATVDIAHMNGNGKPNTEEVILFFQRRMKVESQWWSDWQAFQRRGYVRNLQLQRCKTEWIMFGDSDMVYHPDYFERLAYELEVKHAKASYMISSGRTSNPKEQTTAMVNSSINGDPVEIMNAFARANELPKHPMRNCGAGFCQIINVKHAPHGGYYVEPDGSRDWDWDRRGSNPRSDVQFRRRISSAGGPRQGLPQWFSENAIHLNHNRDPDAGRHLEEQR